MLAGWNRPVRSMIRNPITRETANTTSACAHGGSSTQRATAATRAR